MSVHSAYYLRATGRMGGEMIVVVKRRSRKANLRERSFIKDESES